MLKRISNLWKKTPKKTLICPFCLTPLEYEDKAEECGTCQTEIPPLYMDSVDEAPPFFVQTMGWSKSGKTVYLSALTLMLRRMARIWSDGYAAIPANEASQRRVTEVDQFERSGQMPNPTPLGLNEAYIMILSNMQRWGGRSLVIRDCAGENFEDFNFPMEALPYLSRTPCVLMFMSLNDLLDQGRSIDSLMTAYINTMLRNKIDFKNQRRSLVVVLSKADKIRDLPDSLREYLSVDPLWAAVDGKVKPPPFENHTIEKYIKVMDDISSEVHYWLDTYDASVSNMVGMAKSKNIDIRFSVVSSTGGDTASSSNQILERIRPRRVLDPYFWALEFQKNNTL